MPETQAWASKEREILQNLEPFSQLPDPLREETLNNWERCNAQPGELIFKKGQNEYTHLYVVFDGMVRIVGIAAQRAMAGNPQRPVLGLRELLHGGPCAYQALVAEPTNYARLPAAHIRRLREQDSNFEAILQRDYEPLDDQADADAFMDNVEKRPALAFLQEWYGDRPWGSILDAGTGDSSLRWIMQLPTERWVAVTGDPLWTKRLQARFGSQLRERDRLVEHNWTDEKLLEAEQFDVVIADYLLGAIERFAPYFQEKLWSRLRPHVGQFLFVVGLEPQERIEPKSAGGQLVQTIIRLRDSLLLMTGSSRFREYPLSWVEDTLQEAGFLIETTQIFPNRFGLPEIDAILDNCLCLLPDLLAPDLAISMANHIKSLRERAMSSFETHFGIRFGQDYAVVARPA